MHPLESISFLNHSFEIIRKKRRKSLSVKLQPQCYRIYANNSISSSFILTFLMSKKKWLEKNIEILKNEQKNIPIIDFLEGNLFPFLGNLKYFNFVLKPSKKIHFAVEDGFLICYLPKNKPELQDDKVLLKKVLIEFYKKYATDYLVKRCKDLGRKMNLSPARIKIQTAQRRWGSCTSKKNINLNWKLLIFPPRLIDYVIVHELCHLQHLNHSKSFWNLVEHFYPHYLEAENEIKSQAAWATFLDI